MFEFLGNGINFEKSTYEIFLKFYLVTGIHKEVKVKDN